MRQDVLSEIYEKKPDVQAQVASSSGYGVFSNVNVNFLIASVGGGYGVVRDNRTGQETYMNMGEVGLGLGAGLKDFRALFVFHTQEALDYFVNKGWAFGAHADAAAKASDKGGAVGGEVLVNNVSIYQLTKSGLALQATLKGAKFWKNKSLNNQQYQQVTPATATTYPQGTATTYPQGTTTYQQGSSTYQQGSATPRGTATTYPTYPQGTTSTYNQGSTTTYQGTTTYPQGSATTYPQGTSTQQQGSVYSQSTPYPQAETRIEAVPYTNTETTTTTYQQGPQYLPQGTQTQSQQYIQQGTEYIQQQGSQLPGSQQIQQGTQYIEQGQEYIKQGTQYEQLGY